MKKVFKVEDLDCAHCAGLIEDAVKKIAGVKDASLNFMMMKLSVEAEEADFPRIQKEIKKVAKKVEPDCTIVF